MPVKVGAWQEDKRTEPIVIEGERLYQWMLEQVSEKVPREPEETPTVIHIEGEPLTIETRITMPLKEAKDRIKEMSAEEAKAALEAVLAESHDAALKHTLERPEAKAVLEAMMGAHLLAESEVAEKAKAALEAMLAESLDAALEHTLERPEAKAALEAMAAHIIVAESEVAEEAARAPEAALPEASIVIEEPAAALPVTMEITQVQAFQPPQAGIPIGIGKAGRPFSGFVRSDEPFVLEVSFELAGPGADDVAKRRTTYSAQFHVRNLTTSERTHLGDARLDTLVEGELSYTATLPEATLQSGMYRLRVLATLQDGRTAPGYLEVPLLQVV
jgi:predicted negative regulator of RcsB-dependent stress response